MFRTNCGKLKNLDRQNFFGSRCAMTRILQGSLTFDGNDQVNFQPNNLVNLAYQNVQKTSLGIVIAKI